ncbi:SAM-dependent methyltransferase [Actinomycetospora cinnamomea]|uniref:Methyltransferase family protein n=1 Tax=Actinomycetospora cinnamomea TaxID=663609 RepID=A0A2U1EDH9_9PSEU|nr:methyltransferase domain-containing protein [Actinomycetospora cinnamomea]PVY98016.1 methyltransferase family protein [Actinomycetospora cinnamomea]
MTDTEHEPTDAARFWDDLYTRREIPWGARVNPVLAEVAEPLEPGTALDLGTGAGGDAVWLARRGWRVTAVDIAAAAVAGVREHAAAAGLAEQITAERHDLPRTFPAGTFDLVSAQYFHSVFDFARADVLRTAARALRPAGLLLVVDHGSIAPWSWNQDPDTHFPTPQEVAAELDLPSPEWSVLRADIPRRVATGPRGEIATVTDNVLILQRATD